MEEKKFTLVLDEKTLTSPDRYGVDQFGNRFMMFTDSAGNKTRVRRDDMIIDMETGICKQRNPGKIDTFKA
ncbi:MAG: hypothetical protein KJ697_03410 [Nanoarchaeota archaeon]|nr:hypothetical protein [Nanoarchaeota archaeon]MBU4124176.1 hypothetical protein [Nanoarchaeota archaeon]